MYRTYELAARGDPGFFSFLGKIAKTVVSSVIPGGSAIVGAVDTIAGALGGGSHPAVVQHALTPIAGALQLPPPPTSMSLSMGPVAVQQGIINTQVTTGVPGISAAAMAAAGQPVPKGYHWSKPRKGHPSHLVRNRHMNWANGRALSRAERRVGKFVHHAQHLIKWVHPHKKGRAVPRIGRGKK